MQHSQRVTGDQEDVLNMPKVLKERQIQTEYMHINGINPYRINSDTYRIGTISTVHRS